jgi:translation initiation factor IF-1
MTHLIGYHLRPTEPRTLFSVFQQRTNQSLLGWCWNCRDKYIATEQRRRNTSMAKNDYLTMKGSVTEVLPGNQYRVKIEENDHTILAYLSGRMKQHKIHVIAGDSVEVEVSIYDVNKGRISFRHR